MKKLHKLISTPGLAHRYQVVDENGLPEMALTLFAHDQLMSASHARVARMRRRSKDDLIVRLLRAEEMLKAARAVENQLREEIIRLHVAHGPKTI